MQELIELLKKEGVLRSSAVASAFELVDRKDFVPRELVEVAYENVPLPIGEGQTISQPYTVAFMLELLNPSKGDCIMEIGYGSGWQTALLAALVGEKGKIYALELVKNLCEYGKQNVAKYSELFKRVEFFCQDASLGLAQVAKTIGGFHKIVAAAQVKEVPASWREQLRIGGTLLYPRAHALLKETKQSDESFSVETYSGFSFVPFVQGNGIGEGS